ncbi:hypothetical protein [Leptospira kmetyi]|uniref:Uncharacterized protein n=1 Tax=Leptospira kmetyi TaxID=408139 RepID=A0ABX4N8A3_9LEPT|nr:hypothetical protein [Leptospira kmetyi]PJZ29614.1 hypothetical protein CH378_11720 [Leptospira kmetyi]
MKSHITVLIRNSTKDVDKSLKQILEPHRLDEDNVASIRSHHWDYWYFPNEPILFDEEFRTSHADSSTEILENSSYVRNLPEEYSTSGIILLDGSWIDLQDFGWKMLREHSAKNDEAWKKWAIASHRILAENREQICVQVILHS